MRTGLSTIQQTPAPSRRLLAGATPRHRRHPPFLRLRWPPPPRMPPLPPCLLPPPLAPRVTPASPSPSTISPPTPPPPPPATAPPSSSLYMNSRLHPTTGDGGGGEVKQGLDIMMRPKKRNHVIVSDADSMALTREVLLRIQSGDAPRPLGAANVVSMGGNSWLRLIGP